MTRRDFLQFFSMSAASKRFYAQGTAGLPALKIRDVKVVATSPPGDPGGKRQWVFVKIHTDEPGLYGVGSATNRNNCFAVVAAIENHYAPWWKGKAVDRIEDLWHETNHRGYWRNATIVNQVLSALDMALWDIKGKRAGMPVYDLLGGKARDGVALYDHCGGRTKEEVVADVSRSLEEGFRHVRVQYAGGYGGGGFREPDEGGRPEGGFGGVAFDEAKYIEEVPKLFEYVRTQLGPAVELLHDVHEHLTPSAAMEFCRRVQDVRMFFVEDPLPPEQIEWFERLRAASTTPLAMGELFTHPLEWRPLIAKRLVDFIRCRVSAVGGITPADKIAVLCEHFGVRTAFQEGGDNDPINQLAAYHVDLSSTAFGIQEEHDFPDLIRELLPGTAEQRGGYLYGNGAPGLGIDIREDVLLSRYPLEAMPIGAGGKTVRSMDGGLVRP